MIDVLAQQSDEELARLLLTTQADRARLEADLGRVTVEEQLIEQAIAKRGRRLGAGVQARGKVSRDQVYEVVAELGEAVSANYVQTMLADKGISASVNSVRNHLNRLVDENRALVRLDDGKFALPPPAKTYQPTDDSDIPF